MLRKQLFPKKILILLFVFKQLNYEILTLKTYSQITLNCTLYISIRIRLTLLKHFLCLLLNIFQIQMRKTSRLLQITNDVFKHY